MRKTKVWSKALVILSVVALLGTSLVGCGTQSSNQGGTKEKKTIRLTIGSANTVASGAWTKKMDEFFTAEVSKRAEANTDYKIEWNKVYGGSVAKVGEELSSVQNKLVDVSMVVFPYEASKLPLQNFAYWVPFGPPDSPTSAKVVRQLIKEFPALTDPFEKQFNQKFLGFATTQNYNLVTTFPVETIAALKGHKIAAVGPNLHFLKGSGAVPVQSTIPEMYTSFQTGVYEGWIMFLDAVLNSKIYEVAPYYNKTDFGAVLLSAITINKDTWNSLPKEVQDIVAKVGDEYIDVMAKYSADTYENQIKDWQAKGGKVVQFKAEDRAKWAEMLPNTPNEKAKEMDAKGLPGSAMMKRYFELLKQNGYTPPRDWKIE